MMYTTERSRRIPLRMLLYITSTLRILPNGIPVRENTFIVVTSLSILPIKSVVRKK